MELSGEHPTLTRGLNNTLDWLMSVCVVSLGTDHALPVELWGNLLNALILWLSSDIKNKMPRSLLFIISLYVVQISQDMESVSLVTYMPWGIQAWNAVMCHARKKGSPVKLEMYQHLWLHWFILSKNQAHRQQIRSGRKQTKLQFLKSSHVDNL